LRILVREVGTISCFSKSSRYTVISEKIFALKSFPLLEKEDDAKTKVRQKYNF
jgi:hypothetical protein